MSGQWYGPGSPPVPRDPNAPTDDADIYEGTEGDDYAFDDEGNPTRIVQGRDGNDTMLGLGGNDVLAGNEGADSLLGGAGDDELYGGAGDDVLHGGAGDDILYGQAGNDSFYGGDAQDAEGSTGIDTVVLGGSPGSYAWTATVGGWLVTDLDPNEGEDDGTDFIASDIEWIHYTATEETLATPCFAEGTRIMTARGERRVESLRAGDLIVTLGLRGAWLRPVRWIGHRQVDCRRHPRPATVRPVRLREGCLGRGVPHRDLLVSPDHAILVEDALVPAGALLDGDWVVQEEPAGRLRYFHVELDAHDILLAEGAPAESWLDCGNRSQFDNGGLVVRLHPDFGRRTEEEGACAAMVTEGPRLAALRMRLAARRGARLVERAARMRRGGAAVA